MKYLLIGVISVFVFTACTRKFEEYGNMTVFRYNESAGITSLDPAYAKDQANIWAVNQLYNGLIQLNNKLECIPCIAKSWTISENGLTYTFHLRKDVFFHDHEIFPEGKGRRVVASDFVYSFNRILNPEQPTYGAWVFNNVAQSDGRYAFKALNDETLQIDLKKAFPPFLSLLSMQYCVVLPKEVAGFYGKEFRKHPVGTGPFMFAYWKEGEKLVLRRNKHYFEFDGTKRLPYLDAVSISFIVDKQSAFLEFIKGNLDFVSGLHPSYKDEVLTKKGTLRSKYKDKINLISQPYLNTEYLAFQLDSTNTASFNSALLDKRVRQAMNYGFDRKKMITYLRNNIGYAGIYGMIPPGLPAFDSLATYGYIYDPEKSRKLLTEAGFPDGAGLGDIQLSTTSEYLDLCKYIQHELDKIGMDIKIDVNPPPVLKELKAQAKLPFFRASWIADYPDAENYLSLFLKENYCPEGPNYTHFSNSLFEELYHMAQLEIRDNMRYDLYKQMDSLVMAEAPVIILYYDQVLRFSSPKISGLGSNAMNLLDLKRVRKENGKNEN